ncbi:coiled-coil domain-containing protein 69 isoform X3 [Rattus norvegicus]|uniref:coiled-coil domain-containing protein 69 isoform X3 n=1 Tax=Rattus norvegicus TaxID=10116 RepID=UPI0003D077EC|nr:coiled-coil domain-containing protein 69 isoform X2 [Rattus norvegicus]|eukprot:XP_006246456.1 PREDICTED: coiled-coil domain-containing protein 69 isoform X2 [Rattus norvegicus]
MGCRHSRHSRGKRAEKVEETQTELLETLDKEGRILEGRHEETGQVQQTSNAQEKDALSDCVLEAKASLQNTCAIHVPPQEARQAKMNKVDGSILSRLYRNHIQDYGSPGPFWEQELESLHHVIEMKNERIHELEKQLFLLEMLVAATRAVLGASSLAPQEGWQPSHCRQRLRKEVRPTGQADKEARLSNGELGS